MTTFARTLAGSLALAAVGACSQAPRPPSPEVFTLFDAQRLVAQFGPEHVIATGAGVPGGVRLSAMLDSADPERLASDPTRTGGEEQGTYATTEVWTHFDRLWIQPMYVLVSRWESGRPIVWPPHMDTPTRRSWVFSVGPESGFYSPFWQMIYVDVSDETTARSLTSARQILDGGFTLHPGPGHMVTLAPDGVSPPDGTRVGTGQAWLDGTPYNFLDFGTGIFTWDAQGVIAEIPIYVFLMRNTEGNWVAPPLPTVSGVAPHGTSITGDMKAPFIGGDYRWASYWRIYTVKMPPAARVIAPKDSALWTALGDLGVARADDIAPSVYEGIPSRVGTVQLNPGPAFGSTDPDGGAPATGCFASNVGCQPVDSQYRIQNDIDPSAVQRTDLTVTCPFMTYEGKAVVPLP